MKNEEEICQQIWLSSPMTSSYEEFYLERERIRKGNEELIAYWKSIPWWKFWERPSFEEQRKIIMDNFRR